MLLVRTVAVGLGLSAYLMYTKYTTWAKWFLSDALSQPFWNGLHALSESVASTVPLGAVSTAGFILTCLAIGLFISGCLYPPFESFLLSLGKRVKIMATVRNRKPIITNREVEEGV